MLALKILGILLILAVGGISSYGSVRYEKRSVYILDEWIDLIRHIRTQIDCYLTPLDEILAEALTEKRELSTLLEETSIYLDGASRHVIKKFIGEIGGSYREEQLRLCDFCVEELRCRRASHAAQLPTRIKLSVTLSLCISIGSAILLW